MKLCNDVADAVNLEAMLQNEMKGTLIDSRSQSDLLRSKAPPILSAELTLLKLAGNDTCDGIFYVMPIVMDIDNSKIMYMRYFESGWCRGFFDHVYKNHFFDSLRELGSDISKLSELKYLYSPIYTDWDTAAMVNYTSAHTKGEVLSEVYKQEN